MTVKMRKLRRITPKKGCVRETLLIGGSAKAITFGTNFIGSCGIIIQRSHNFKKNHTTSWY